jgi:hypothetical protein
VGKAVGRLLAAAFPLGAVALAVGGGRHRGVSWPSICLGRRGASGGSNWRRRVGALEAGQRFCRRLGRCRGWGLERCVVSPLDRPIAVSSGLGRRWGDGLDRDLFSRAEIYRGADALVRRSLGQVMWAWKILVSQAGRYPLNVDPKLLKPGARRPSRRSALGHSTFKKLPCPKAKGEIKVYHPVAGPGAIAWGLEPRSPG